uniref:Expressed protein n=1 Tax=Schizophyllum commune (strain H4-8 / FGSC 9210) TaxID=578458 RepID=D8QGW5_SCHCM
MSQRRRRPSMSLGRTTRALVVRGGSGFGSLIRRPATSSTRRAALLRRAIYASPSFPASSTTPSTSRPRRSPQRRHPRRRLQPYHLRRRLQRALKLTFHFHPPPYERGPRRRVRPFQVAGMHALVGVNDQAAPAAAVFRSVGDVCFVGWKASPPALATCSLNAGDTPWPTTLAKNLHRRRRSVFSLNVAPSFSTSTCPTSSSALTLRLRRRRRLLCPWRAQRREDSASP